MPQRKPPIRPGMVIDVHQHAFPREIIDLMRDRPILSAAPTVSQVVKWTPQGAVDEMDAGNVDMALLSRPLQGDMPTAKASAIRSAHAGGTVGWT